ncbi:MAG: hypothetical protein JNK29_19875, partial [Anaerolineales bacterium]|nr:hypothetical protein [Anaerolineales bacterium]
GLASYDVQLQTPAGPDWTPWLTGTTAVELDYLAPAAGAHVVRVRAADQVGNLSAWQSITVTVAAVTKYYQFNGQRLVLRQGSAVYYLHGDHLGSAALVTDAAGGVVSQARYLPFGQERLTAGASPSDFAFTGQRREGFGLLDYNGRYYAPQLAQFISADPVAPAVLSTQALNRFAYVLYNPLKFVDPTGYTQKLCGESCENNGGYSGERGNPVNNNMYELTADQYAQLAIFAESSNGSHPDLALYLMAWVAGNSIGQAGNPFEYADKFYYGMRDLLKTFMPFPKPKVFHLFMADAIKAQLDSLTSATRAYIYHRAYTWYSRYAYRGENGYGDEFDKVVTLYSMAKTDRTNGAPDPTGGSTMFNHASYTAYNRTSWPLVGAGGIQSPEQFVAVLTANFEKYKAQVRPDFVYSFYIYPPDSPNVGGLVLVTGNRVCIQGWNGCGAYLP